MAPITNIFPKQTFETHISLKTINIVDIVLFPSKALRNMFFMFRLSSLNTLTIALCRALTLFELPSE